MLKKTRVKDRASTWFTTEQSDLLIQRNKAPSLARRSMVSCDWAADKHLRNKCSFRQTPVSPVIV